MIGSTPRARTARAADAPAIPAPIITTERVGVGGAVPGSLASNLSRLRPNPGFFSTANPAACSPLRTSPATVKVAALAPGAERCATRLITCGVHMSGLSAGENPSRNQASARPPQASNASITPMTPTSNTTRPPPHIRL